MERFSTSDGIFIDDLLNRIGAKLQLDNTRREKAEQAYKTVSAILEEDEEEFGGISIDVFAHGSFATDTTVRPYGKDEYDLDFIALVSLDWNRHNPIEILDRVERVLNGDGRYEKKIERKNRCIRINYAGDFHMDIQPSCPESLWAVADDIKVPDRKSKSWMNTSPKAYIKWFTLKLIDTKLVEKHYNTLIGVSQLIEAAAPLPQSVPYEMKQPLQRAVQLIKRRRDIYFSDQALADKKTRSIILTTLAGEYYDGQESEYETIRKTILRTCHDLEKYGSNFHVYNPVHEQRRLEDREKFTDKWDQEPSLRKAFEDFIYDFRDRILEFERSSDFERRTTQLKELFGETVTTEAFSEQAIHTNSLRDKNVLRVTPAGMIISTPSANTVSIPRNEFYGDQQIKNGEESK